MPGPPGGRRCSAGQRSSGSGCTATDRSMNECGQRARPAGPCHHLPRQASAPYRLEHHQTQSKYVPAVHSSSQGECCTQMAAPVPWRTMLACMPVKPYIVLTRVKDQHPHMLYSAGSICHQRFQHSIRTTAACMRSAERSAESAVSVNVTMQPAEGHDLCALGACPGTHSPGTDEARAACQP